MAATPVLGIDFGNESSFIAVARAGGIEVLTNDYSLRDTPCYVAFTSKNRLLGTSAKNQVITNINNTVFSFKRILGLRFDDPMVQEEQQYLSYPLVQTSNGGVGVKVYYLGEETVFSIEQITAMLLTKLKEDAEAALECKVFDCVLCVPYFFTDAQRRALLDAAGIANLQVLRLMNEPTAAALSYGLYRTATDLPNPEQPPRHVAFVDFGFSALQVAIAAFHKGKLKMLATSFDPSLGGRSFDTMIAHQLVKSFNKPGSDVTKNKRAWLRLVAEVGKLKRQMSANISSLPINIECLLDERDFSAAMKRSEMEELCAPLLARVEAVLQRCLDESGLKKEDISEIELIGGSTRMPSVKALIEKVYGRPPSTTLNQDECVSRGAAIMAAMLSPNFKVREFSVTDLQPYPITISWGEEGTDHGELEVFPKFHAVPFSKLLTFFRKAPFTLTARYSAGGEYTRIHKDGVLIGQFHVQNVKPGSQGEAQKVKVKVRVNQHGVFQVASATLLEKQVNGESAEVSGQQESKLPKADSAEAEGMETEANVAGENQEPQQAADAGNKMETSEAEGQQTAAPKQTVKSIDLPVSNRTASMEPTFLQTMVEKEAELKAQDRRERDRIDSKNALEEFVLNIRGKVTDPDDLEPYVEPSVRDELLQMADHTENWLYDEGEDCEKHEYVDRLQAIQGLAGPAQSRRRDFEEIPAAAEQFTLSLHRAQKALDSYRAGDAAFEHWTPEEARKVEGAIDEKRQWLDANRSRVLAAPKTRELPVKAAAFHSERQGFESAVASILNKPKPQPPAPEPAPQQPAGAAPESATPGGEKMDTD